jgi:hypothetical protein
MAILGPVVGLVTGLGVWMTESDHPGTVPAGEEPRELADWRFTGPEAEALRKDALRRATVRIAPASGVSLPATFADGTSPPAATPCRYVNHSPSGTTPKFHCVVDEGTVVKVKYGRNAEIHAEAAATRLVRALGFAADDVGILARLRCYGCPRLPFESALLLSLIGLREQLGSSGHESGYTDFEWVSVERQFPAPAIATDEQEGWAWWELKDAVAAGADLDALRLLAAFLGHWDNKAENQRLVCLDGPQATPNQPCQKPLLMMQDLGATFGPPKVNLANWRQMPIWDDPRACRLSMRMLPYHGATFSEIAISEEGRAQLARQLTALSGADIRTLFADARFPQYYSPTPDDRDLAAWVEAFRARVDQIVKAGPCPKNSQPPTPNSQTSG